MVALHGVTVGIREGLNVRPYTSKPAYFLCGIGVTPTCSSAVYGAP